MGGLNNNSNMWKVEHDTVIEGEPLHAEAVGADATEIVRNIKDQLKIHSPGALSMIRRTIAELIKKGGDDIVDGEDRLNVYEIPDIEPAG
jgi:hypothetical protein